MRVRARLQRDARGERRLGHQRREGGCAPEQPGRRTDVRAQGVRGAGREAGRAQPRHGGGARDRAEEGDRVERAEPRDGHAVEALQEVRRAAWLGDLTLTLTLTLLNLTLTLTRSR